MTKAQSTHKLKVALELSPLVETTYEATVTVTITDTCYHPGELKIGLPPHHAGIPETEYLTFFFTHDDDKMCGQVVRDVSKSIKLHASSAKTHVTAFCVVNDQIAGEASKPAPRPTK